MTDGSKTVHSATIYWPDHPDGPPPAIDKEKDVFLKFKGEGTEEGQEGLLLWDVTQDGETLRTYNESDIRFSLVYRARLVRTDRYFLYLCRHNVGFTQRLYYTIQVFPE